MDIGDLCFYCREMDPDRDCERCPSGNPCFGCPDYSFETHNCISNGACFEEKKSD